MDCSCSCTIDNTDASGSSAFRQTERKARKNHTCYECRRVIASGEKYVYESGVWDGQASDYKTCLECFEIRGVFFQGGYIYGNLYSDIKNMIGDIDGDVPPRMSQEIIPQTEGDSL